MVAWQQKVGLETPHMAVLQLGEFFSFCVIRKLAALDTFCCTFPLFSGCQYTRVVHILGSWMNIIQGH